VPSIALRFDYSQTGTAIGGGAVTPFVSIYYTDFVGKTSTLLTRCLGI
jgi:hypothetical protein